ncbi:YciI family protein [Actinomadura scrupuli]|uniref:YciI family protein n=1 Tax=Actinomadura scrupuli TaxID=559629 RepID=UPI003D981CF6
MKYMLLICADESLQVSPEQASVEPWLAEMEGRGVRLHGDRLRPVGDATTVRVRGGETLLTDGPFAETKEQIAGYDVIDCADLDEAIEVASKHPVAAFGTVEVRPFWQG